MNYLIRKSQLQDMAAVVSAHRRSILDICSKDYTQDQISKWSQVVYSEETWKEMIQNELHYVIEVNGCVEGFCHSKVYPNGEGEIKGLYFTNVLSGMGAGREVFELSMDYLKANNCRKVFIYATKTALGFYQKMGFHSVQSLTINVRGADLECFRMEWAAES